MADQRQAWLLTGYKGDLLTRTDSEEARSNLH
jgi:hypothetical protein